MMIDSSIFCGTLQMLCTVCIERTVAAPNQCRLPLPQQVSTTSMYSDHMYYSGTCLVCSSLGPPGLAVLGRWLYIAEVHAVYVQ